MILSSMILSIPPWLLFGCTLLSQSKSLSARDEVRGSTLGVGRWMFGFRPAPMILSCHDFVYSPVGAAPLLCTAIVEIVRRLR
jgi:hypothetical protein